MVDSLEREVVVLVVFVGYGVMFTFFELFFNEFFDVGIELFMLFSLELLKFTGKLEIQFFNEGCDFAFRFRVENEVNDSSWGRFDDASGFFLLCFGFHWLFDLGFDIRKTMQLISDSIIDKVLTDCELVAVGLSLICQVVLKADSKLVLEAITPIIVLG